MGRRAHDGTMSSDRIVVLGPPGSGKGTQARRLAERLGVPHVSVGQLLRDEIAAGTDLGRRIEREVEAGDLVDDSVVVDVIVERLGDSSTGWILDGAPRTFQQAVLLAPLLEEPASGEPAEVVFLDVPSDEIRRRLTARAEREDRADDTPEVIEHRIATWAEEAPPLLSHYREREMLTMIDGTGDIEQIADQISAAVA
ncbi:MAG: adenylate kinase [Ilumatobacter sp.]|nr:MAG: adenylate kinase [Ilumatobacter sp.]